jgi:hypothetical protein
MITQIMECSTGCSNFIRMKHVLALALELASIHHRMLPHSSCTMDITLLSLELHSLQPTDRSTADERRVYIQQSDGLDSLSRIAPSISSWYFDQQRTPNPKDIRQLTNRIRPLRSFAKARQHPPTSPAAASCPARACSSPRSEIFPQQLSSCADAQT